ncbi:zinc finger and BTB domain-containing protein 45-like isoform X2 [Amphibalanus amphitrite]|uniref:zinc finger and BTB domain-containing protein 45-like isoform X2 n=1 Tax=Amphibalanus amphitrite TaxID=1232801 RepID=UPI001C926D06|nr:zinc finger and BTB domain-containing protein 45-like isoform X2 [Amphibalanus amphitrite]XP_043209865.1 zinc finger and BTB domain-containing protein 45-like isoform X2 [Amphibalanus amphitrite]
MNSQKFCLKWDSFQGTVTSLFDQLRHDGELVDVTLCCEGQRVRAHRMMLSACSPYFRQLIQENPCQQLVFFLKDTSADDLRAIIEFIYKGSVNVAQSQLASFIKTAELLQIRGLSGEEDKPSAPAAPAALPSPAAKRRRLSDHDPPRPPSAPAPSPGRRPSQSPSLTSPSEHSAPPSPAPRPPPPPPPAAAAAPVKVEKTDPIEEDGATLDDTLGYVAEFEGGDYPARPPLDALAFGQMAGTMIAPPGTSQRLSEDGSSQAGHQCQHCERVFQSRSSLRNHAKQHVGRTQCALCGGVYASVPTLRRHLVTVHGQSAEQVYALVPSEPRGRRPAPPPPAIERLQQQGLQQQQQQQQRLQQRLQESEESGLYATAETAGAADAAAANILL